MTHALRFLAAASVATVLLCPAASFAQEAPEDPVAVARALPRSADAALNAGIASAEVDDLGPAVLWLERAALLAPIDREIEDALQAAHREARRARAERFSSGTLIEGEPPMLFWWRFLQGINENTLAWLLVTTNAFGFVLLTLARRDKAGHRRDLLHVAAAILLVAMTTSAALWATRTVLASQIDPAVVLPADPQGRSAPDELAALRRLPDLFAGAVVLINDERGSWRRVQLVSGESVWLDATEIERIRNE